MYSSEDKVVAILLSILCEKCFAGNCIEEAAIFNPYHSVPSFLNHTTLQYIKVPRRPAVIKNIQLSVIS